MFRSSGYLDISNYSSVPVQDQKQAPEKESIKILFARETNNRSSSLTDGSMVIKSDLPTLQARYVLLTAEIERVLSLNSALSQEVETYKNKLWKSEKGFAEQTEDIKAENERLLKNQVTLHF